MNMHVKPNNFSPTNDAAVQAENERERCASSNPLSKCNRNFMIGEIEARKFITDKYAPTYLQGDVVMLGERIVDKWGSFALVQVCDEKGDVFHEVSGILKFSCQWSATVEDSAGQKVTVRCEDFETDETGPLSIIVKSAIRIIRAPCIWNTKKSL